MSVIQDPETVKVKANGIVWDTDGEDSSFLPNSATVTVDKEDFETDNGAVSDALSDKFGFSVISIKATKLVG